MVKAHRQHWADLLPTSNGTAAIEMGLVAPVFIMLVMGICDFGLALRVKAQVSNAARAGVEYVMVKGYNQAGAQSAASNATALSVTAVTTTYSGCPTGSGITTVSGSTCDNFGSSAVGNYASVTATATYTPLLSMFWTTSPTFSTTVVTRY